MIHLNDVTCVFVPNGYFLLSTKAMKTTLIPGQITILIEFSNENILIAI